MKIKWSTDMQKIRQLQKQLPYIIIPYNILQSMDSLDKALADFDSLLILRNEVVVTSGQGFLKTLVDELGTDNGFQFEETAEDNHVENLGDTHFLSLLSGSNLVDVDIFAGGLAGDSVGVVNQQAARLHSILKLVERLLVEDDGSVVFADDGGADALVADDDGNVGGTTTLLRTIGGHPADFFIFHNARIGKDFAHREDTLATKTGDDNFFCHDIKMFYYYLLTTVKG